MQELLAVKPAAWRKETAEMREYLKEFGARAPAEMSAELDEIESAWRDGPVGKSRRSASCSPGTYASSQ